MAETQSPNEDLPQGDFIKPASTDIKQYLPFGNNPPKPDSELYTPVPVRQQNLSGSGLPGRSSNIQQYAVKDKVTGYPPFSPNQLPQSTKDGDLMIDHLNTLLQKRSQSVVDNNQYAKPFMYDASATGANKARYKAYGQKTYDKIGFSPEINNEEVFNANTSMLDDYIRMGTHSFLPMLGNGLFANPKSYGQLIAGDIGQDSDSAEDYEKYNNLGYSTKGGVFGFVNNLLNSVAYSVGVMAETTAEYAAIGAVEGSLVGPEGTALGGALGGATGAIKGLATLPKALWNMGKFGGAMLKNLKNLERYNAAQRLFLQASRTTVNFVNPLSNTTSALKEAYGTANNLTNLARASKSAAGFFRDVSWINSGWSEGRLEGGMGENNAYKKGYDRFWLENNRAPNEQEQLDLRKTAKLVGFEDTYKNGLLVMYSNKIAFPNLFKGNMLTKYTRNITTVGKEFDIIYQAAKKGTLKEGKSALTQGAYEIVDFNLRNALKGLVRPANLGRASINYFKTNLVEGTQEYLQDVIANYSEQYYLDAYFDKTPQNFRYSMATLRDAFGQANERGFETFASGFFMGGLLRPFGGAVPRYASMMYTKAKMDPKEYELDMAERKGYGERLVNAMNRMDKNPADFLSDRVVNFGVASTLSRVHNSDDTDTKGHKDAVQAGFANDVLTVSSSGTFDIWKGNFKRFQQLNEKELEEAFELEPGQGAKAKKMLDDYIKKADKIQSRYNYAMDTFGKKKIDTANLKENTPEYDKAQIYNRAIDHSIKNMLFLQDAFDNNLERLNKMHKAWSILDPNAKLPGFDFNTLTDNNQLNNTIDMLSTEIESMKQAMESAPANSNLSSKIEEKRELLEDLKNYQKNQEEYIIARYKNEAFAQAKESFMKEYDLSEEDAEVKAFEEVIEGYNKAGVNPVENYKTSYKNLLKRLAGDDVNYHKMMSTLEENKSFEDLFKDLMDMHALTNENKVIVPYINLLLDTDGFYEHVDRNFKWMENLYKNRKEYYKNAVNTAIEMKEYNDLLKALSDQNIYVDLEQFADWVEDKNNLPDYFIDATTDAERIIPKDSLLYQKYIDIFERVTNLQQEKPAGNPADLKSLMDQEIEDLLQQKDKDLADAETHFKSDIELERGAPLEKLRETEDASKLPTESGEPATDPTQEILDKFKGALELAESDQVNLVFDVYKYIWKNSLIDLKQFNDDPAKYEAFFLKKIKKIQNNKKRMAEEVMPLADSYDWTDKEDTLNAALYYFTVLEIINEEIEKAKKEAKETVTAEPVVLVENSESWKDYQAVLKSIEAKYKKLIDEVTKKYAQQGLKPETSNELTINTPWDEITDDKFKTKLTKLFDEYLKNRGQENLLAENPDEYTRLRDNWFREQGDLIKEYNDQIAATALKKEREAGIISEPKLKYYKSNGNLISEPLSELNKLLDRLYGEKELGMKTDKNDNIVKLTDKEKSNLDSDIAAIEELIEKKRNSPAQLSNFQKSIDLFKEKILDRQAEVEQILDEEGNVESRKLDGKTPQRVTNVAETLDIELTPGKKPYLYSPLEDKTKDVLDEEGNVIDQETTPSPILEIFDLINNDDAIKPEARVNKFIDKFLQLKYPAFEETTKNKITGKKVENPKIEALRQSLTKDFSRENVIKTIQKLSSKEAADVGNTMDVLIKEFLTREGASWKKVTKPDNMTQEVFDNLFGSRGVITRFRDSIIDGEYYIVGASTLVFDKTLGEMGIAGETDLIAIDAKGNFNIIDVKALTKDKWDVFHGDVRYKKRVAKLTKEGLTEEEIAKDKDVITYGKEKFKSKKQYFRLQQSIYRNLFFNMTGILPKRIGLLPIEVEYDKLGNIVSAKLSDLVPKDQTTIELFYMPEVEAMVPLKAAPVAPPTGTPTSNIEAQKAELNKLKDLIAKTDDLRSIMDDIFKVLDEKKYENWQETLDEDQLKKDLQDKVDKAKSQEDLANNLANIISKYLLPKFIDTELAALEQQPVSDKADIENKIKAFDKTIENEFEEGDYRKVLVLAEKQVKDGTIPQIPENVQLITNYPKLFEEFIKATDARNKTIDAFDKEAVLAGKPNELPIYTIESTINPATKRLEIRWVENRKEAITNIQLVKINNYAAEELINYKNKLQKELAALEQSTEPVYEVTKPKSKKLKDNIGQTVVYQGQIGELILNNDGTYAIKTSDNNVKIITYAVKNVAESKITFEQAGLLPVQEIKNYGQITNVEGTEIDAEFLDQEETKAVVNGVLYTVDRNEFGNIETLTYESNASEIVKTQEELDKTNSEIDALRAETETLTSQETYDNLQKRIDEITEALTNTSNDEVIQRLTKKRIVLSDQFQQIKNTQNANIRKIAQLEINKQSLKAKLSNLKTTNFKRTLTGGNANDIIFALNALPNSFQKATKKLKPNDQQKVLKEISRQSTSPTAATSIDEIFEDMPYAVYRLWAGGINAINELDLKEIQAWANSTIQRLTNLASVLDNKGDISDDVTNQINTINNFVSQLALIKLNKDGKISKKQSKEAREAFRPEDETSNATPKNEIPVNGQTKGSTGQNSGVEPTADQIKATLRGLNASADELLSGLGSEESLDKMSGFITDMQNAKSNIELDKIYYFALQEIDENPGVYSSDNLKEEYDKAKAKLIVEVTLGNVKNDGYIILKDDTFGYAKGTLWIVVKENQDGTLNIQDIDGIFEETITEGQLQYNFSRINEESMKQSDVEVSQEDQEIANATTKTVEDLLTDSDVLKNAEKEVDEATTKGSFRDKLKNRNCNI